MTPSERLELNRLASFDNPDENLQLRARIVLSWAAGATGDESARLLETSRRTISKWRRRFREGGVDALSDRPRSGAPRSIDPAKIAELLRLQDSPPPSGKSRWTTRLLAQHTGLSQSTVVRISRDHRRGSPTPDLPPRATAHSGC
ncbi:MAG: helix-turn-helix domain-containing protein [Enhygromyxa sp.]